MARIVSRPDPMLATRASLFGELPVAEMIRRGWLKGVDDVRNVKGVEAALCKFFGVSSVDEIEILPHAAKKTDVFGPATPAQLAWLYRVKQLATDTPAAKYSRETLLDTISRFERVAWIARGYTKSSTHVGRVRHSLCDRGIIASGKNRWGLFLVERPSARDRNVSSP